MVAAVAFSVSSEDFAAIPVNRCLERLSGVQEHGSWLGVEYLILCSGHIPSWVAKIQEIVMPRTQRTPMLFRFSEVRSVTDIDDNDEFRGAFKSFQDARYKAPLPFKCDFENDLFFSLGKEVWFKPTPEVFGLLTMEKATVLLAESYGVGPDQVEITIRSRPGAKPKI